jgi:hypothetical protein
MSLTILSLRRATALSTSIPLRYYSVQALRLYSVSLRKNVVEGDRFSGGKPDYWVGVLVAVNSHDMTTISDNVRDIAENDS